MDVLTAHQQEVAGRVLDEESARRDHLVISLSGAHAYGFPSPDSDLDLKAVHIAPTRSLLGLRREDAPKDRLEVIEGVEVDYSSNELQGVLTGVLGGNGNYLERILGPLPLRGSPELASLRPLVQACLCRRLHRHYRGFAGAQLREWEKTGFTSAKKLLYVLRTALTGAHALLTAELVTDLGALAPRYGLEDAQELILQKRRGEKAELPAALAERWRAKVQSLFALLDDAHARSALPEEPQGTAALEAWLFELRARRL